MYAKTNGNLQEKIKYPKDVLLEERNKSGIIRGFSTLFVSKTAEMLFYLTLLQHIDLPGDVGAKVGWGFLFNISSSTSSSSSSWAVTIWSCEMWSTLCPGSWALAEAWWCTGFRRLWMGCPVGGSHPLPHAGGSHQLRNQRQGYKDAERQWKSKRKGRAMGEAAATALWPAALPTGQAGKGWVEMALVVGGEEGKSCLCECALWFDFSQYSDQWSEVSVNRQ